MGQPETTVEDDLEPVEPVKQVEEPKTPEEDISEPDDYASAPEFVVPSDESEAQLESPENLAAKVVESEAAAGDHSESVADPDEKPVAESVAESVAGPSPSKVNVLTAEATLPQIEKKVKVKKSKRFKKFKIPKGLKWKKNK